MKLNARLGDHRPSVSMSELLIEKKAVGEGGMMSCEPFDAVA